MNTWHALSTGTLSYLRSSALMSSPTAWSLLFMKGKRLENEKFFFFFSFELTCCTLPFVCKNKKFIFYSKIFPAPTSKTEANCKMHVKLSLLHLITPFMTNTSNKHMMSMYYWLYLFTRFTSEFDIF